MDKRYKLVHITTGGEYKTPLVASQLFDQAEFQAITKAGFAPEQVEAWIIGSMREYFDKDVRARINSLKERCPHISIRMINGISRLGKYPIPLLLKLSRIRLGKNVRVVYHCRGEHAARLAEGLRDGFPGDIVVLDVRGYWPAELIYHRGVDDPSKAKGADLIAYNRAHDVLKETVGKADAVTTVSQALRELLYKEMKMPSVTAVVPCCVSHITSDDRRDEIRRSWGVGDDEIVLVYSGTTASYQHLEDLTIPFLKKLAQLNSKVRLAFLSSEHEKITQLLINAGVDSGNVIIKGFPQKEVGAALTACDAGILIRKPTLVNRVANPVKIAEYMAAGLPIIIEKGVGGVSDELFEQSLLKGIEVAGGNDMNREAIEVNKWLADDIKSKRHLVRAYVDKVYLWSSAIEVSRKMYEDALSR